MDKLEKAKQAAREAEWSKFKREEGWQRHHGPNTAFLKGFNKGFDAGIAIAESQNDFHTQIAYESGYKAAESQCEWVRVKEKGLPKAVGEYWVTIDDAVAIDELIAIVCFFDSHAFVTNDDYAADPGNVIAWIPHSTPQPYIETAGSEDK